MLITIQSAISQGTVIAILIVSSLLAISLLVLIGFIALSKKQLLRYGNFFVVTLALVTALIGFLVAFPLLVSNVAEPTQVLALLSALFGTIVGLVGTYFGVKSSSDAREGAQQLATDRGTAPPTISSVSPQDRAVDVPPDTRVTVTFSKDMDSASINTNTFKLIEEVTLTPVAGGMPEYDSSTKVATFKPSADLTNGRTYRATLTTGVKDQAGNALVQSFTWHFTVIS